MRTGVDDHKSTDRQIESQMMNTVHRMNTVNRMNTV